MILLCFVRKANKTGLWIWTQYDIFLGQIPRGNLLAWKKTSVHFYDARCRCNSVVKKYEAFTFTSSLPKFIIIFWVFAQFNLLPVMQFKFQVLHTFKINYNAHVEGNAVWMERYSLNDFLEYSKWLRCTTKRSHSDHIACVRLIIKCKFIEI